MSVSDTLCCSHESKKQHGGRAEYGMFLGLYSLSLGTEPSLLALGKSCLLLDPAAKVLVQKSGRDPLMGSILCNA